MRIKTTEELVKNAPKIFVAVILATFLANVLQTVIVWFVH